MMNWEHASTPVFWIAWLFGATLLIVPVVQIVRKAGYSGWWVLFAIVFSFIPLLNLILLWIFAFARWPLEERAASR